MKTATERWSVCTKIKRRREIDKYVKIDKNLLLLKLISYSCQFVFKIIFIEIISMSSNLMNKWTFSTKFIYYGNKVPGLLEGKHAR